MPLAPVQSPSGVSVLDVRSLNLWGMVKQNELRALSWEMFVLSTGAQLYTSCTPDCILGACGISLPFLWEEGFCPEWDGSSPRPFT